MPMFYVSVRNKCLPTQYLLTFSIVSYVAIHIWSIAWGNNFSKYKRKPITWFIVGTIKWPDDSTVWIPEHTCKHGPLNYPGCSWIQE